MFAQRNGNAQGMHRVHRRVSSSREEKESLEAGGPRHYVQKEVSPSLPEERGEVVLRPSIGKFRRGFSRLDLHAGPSSATMFLQDRLQNQAEQEEVHGTCRPDVALTVSGSECHIEQNGSVGDPFRRTDQQRPLARVRPLDRLEV